MISCHLHITTILHLSFQFEYFLFLILVWLLCLGLPILCWIEVVRVGMLVFQILVRIYYVVWESVKKKIYYAEIQSLFTHFAKSFYHGYMLNFIKCFFCVYWDHGFYPICSYGISHWVFAVCWTISVNCMNPTWLWYMIIFYKLLDLVC